MLTYDGRNLIMMSPSPVAAAPPISFCAQDPAPTIGESPTRLHRNKKIMDKSNFRNPQLIMHFSEKDNKSWVSDDGIYYCFIKYLEHKKTKSHKNQHLISIPRYFVVESICSCSRNYMSICINCHHSNCVMVQITNPLVLSGRLFKYVCTWMVRATTFLRIWTDILQNRLLLKYVHICSKTISLKNMKY